MVSVHTYLELCAQYDGTAQLAHRIEDIAAVGQAFYLAQDEKKRSNCATGSSATWRCK